MVTLITVCCIADVDSFCNGCSSNIFRCNCDCSPRNYCRQLGRTCYAAGPYFGRRSITDDETDPSVIFAKIDKNEVKHFITEILNDKV
jgi:hypothetical protein